MTAKRFCSEDDCVGYYTEIIDNEKELDLSLPNPKKNLTIEEVVDLLNELHEENQQIRDLIHTILNQIDAENITSDSAMYSARIIFSGNEFNLIRELWEKEL